MSYRFPNVGRQREAQHRAAQLAAQPGDMLKRRATLTVRCRGGGKLGRVFRIGARLLFVPAGSVRRNVLVSDGRGNGHAEAIWAPPDPYLLSAGSAELIPARCRCHTDPQNVDTADMLSHIRRGCRTMVVPVR